MKISQLFKKKTKKCKGSAECICLKSVEERVSEFEPLLREIERAHPRERPSLINKAPSCLIRFLCECGLNVLKGNLKLSNGQYKALKPYKNSLLKSSEPLTTLKEKKSALLKKKGDALPLLIPIVLSALGSFAGKALAEAVGV
jgi:hypothetical protein